ncbi:MAG: hypothetical protein FJY56_17505 [Betaproteobacteria bacterium]|nr:hypothetical protein [Betaproteobacteria bacterium]
MDTNVQTIGPLIETLSGETGVPKETMAMAKAEGKSWRKRAVALRNELTAGRREPALSILQWAQGVLRQRMQTARRPQPYKAAAHKAGTQFATRCEASSFVAFGPDYDLDSAFVRMTAVALTQTRISTHCQMFHQESDTTLARIPEIVGGEYKVFARNVPRSSRYKPQARRRRNSDIAQGEAPKARQRAAQVSGRVTPTQPSIFKNVN